MKYLERIPIEASLPDSFFAIPTKAYAEVPFRPGEERAFVLSLFQVREPGTELILYTDHEEVRLVGIFPKNSTEAIFGFWETTNASTNAQAFARLEADAQYKGRNTLIGPMNLNTFHDYRLRVTEPPSWQMFDREPVNPSNYPVLLEQLGFQPKNMFESRLITKETVPEVYQDKQLLLEELTKIPYDFIPLNAHTWQQCEAEIRQLVHEIFGANPFYKPISKQEFSLLYNVSFARKLCPHSSVLFRDRVSGKLAAMSFCHPNYQSLNLPAGQSPVFEQDFPQLQRKTLLAKSVGVHPDFRKKGLMSYLGAYGMLCFKELYEEVIFCLMRSDNFSLHFSNQLPFESARYALFEKQLTG